MALNMSGGELRPTASLGGGWGGAVGGGWGGGKTSASAETKGFDPWGESGGRGQAAGMLKNLMTGKYGPKDPSYQFRFGQGQQALERSLAAKGLLGSGRAATELVDYGQGQASTEYGNEMNRFMQLAGVNLDPTAASRYNLQAEGQRARLSDLMGGGGGGGGVSVIDDRAYYDKKNDAWGQEVDAYRTELALRDLLNRGVVGNAPDISATNSKYLAGDPYATMSTYGTPQVNRPATAYAAAPSSAFSYSYPNVETITGSTGGFVSQYGYILDPTTGQYVKAGG